MLKGQELLAKVKELDGASKSELVMACGYHSQKKDGNTRLNFTAFYEALLEAKGMAFGDGAVISPSGRKLGYVCRVQFNGNLLVGKAYVGIQGYAPGTEFEIRNRRGGGFVLVPMGMSSDEGEINEEGLADEEAEFTESENAAVAAPVKGDEEDEEDDSEEIAGALPVFNGEAAQRELAGVGPRY
jgi:hypothetical protein